MSTAASPDVVYPDSDGQPTADNTKQYEWIVTIKGNLNVLFRDRPDVFVAGDHLVYPVEGRPEVRMAPDVYVAFGRPKGHHGSYRVWAEAGVFPQVVFEVWSPGDSRADMKAKRAFYRRFGAEEYYTYDADDNTLEGWLRDGRRLIEVEEMHAHVSPRLGVRFDLSGPELVIRYPDGRPFLSCVELGAALSTAERELERLRAKLRAAGLDPDANGG